MADSPKFARFIEKNLIEALADNPVVLIHGPRQCGKTTLAKTVGEPGSYTYYSFDDSGILAFAKSDPMGFVADLPERFILDEVQRVPEMFAPLKALVDKDRTPGRAILTGSANVLLVPRLSDSLAGRMEILRLHPFAQCELAGKDPGFLDRIFRGNFKMEKHQRLGAELVKRVAAGGYPRALERDEGRRRRLWYQNYIEALIQRDVQDLGKVRSLEALPKLLSAAASQTGRLFNISDLAGPMELSRPTVRAYASFLEHLFLIEILPPWHSNRLSRLIKTPKLHIGDSGLATALLGKDASTLAVDRSLFGQVLETFVLQELKRLASWHSEPLTFHHFRDKEGNEVDVVIEHADGTCVGVEVKSSATVRPEDFKGLKMLREGAGRRFAAGVILHDGETTLRFEDNLFSVPISALWGKTKG